MPHTSRRPRASSERHGPSRSGQGRSGQGRSGYGRPRRGGPARTGSSKTLAFGLPRLTRLAGATGRPKAPRGLVLVPTRELAQQVADVLVPLGRAVGVSIATVYGGVSISRQIANVRHADVVVA